jgi:hypothetical protein
LQRRWLYIHTSRHHRTSYTGAAERAVLPSRYHRASAGLPYSCSRDLMIHDSIPPRPELLISERESIKLDQPSTEILILEGSIKGYRNSASGSIVCIIHFVLLRKCYFGTRIFVLKKINSLKRLNYLKWISRSYDFLPSSEKNKHPSLQIEIPYFYLMRKKRIQSKDENNKRNQTF